MKMLRGTGNLPKSVRLYQKLRQFASETHELKGSERVAWKFPTVAIENGNAHLRDIVQALEHDPNSPISIEVARIFGVYRDDLLKCLTQHERRYNKGSMPQVVIVRDRPARCAVEHAAMHVFCCAWQDVLTDATEETHLLHPDSVGP